MGFAAAILAMVLLFAGCGQTETKSESSGTKKHRIRKYSIRKYADREQHSGIGNRR